MYSEGYNTVEIGNKLNRNNSSIGRFLKKRGFVNNKTGRKLSDENINEIKNLYIKGFTSREIFKKFKDKIKCEETIQVIIRKSNLSRPRGHRNILKEDYFKNIDTPNKAYFLGLLLADGNVCEVKGKQDVIQIQLVQEDKYILDIFKNELKTDNIVGTYKNKHNGKFCRFSVSSNNMSNDLNKYGVVPRKSLIINSLPVVPYELIRDLIRGYFDGNGSVYILKSNNKIRLAFYGTHNLMDSINKMLHKEIYTSLNKITDQKKTKVSFISFGKKKDIINFYNYIYY